MDNNSGENNSSKEIIAQENMNNTTSVSNENISDIEPINLNKDTKPLYPYANQPVNSSNVPKYNYGNRHNYSSYNNQNANPNTYQQSYNAPYIKEGKKLDRNFILILSSCALLACILIGLAGFGVINFVKNYTNNRIGTNGNNTLINNPFNNGNGIYNNPFNSGNGTNNNQINNPNINYDNFLKITSTSTLDDVKRLLNSSPASGPLSNSTTLTEYSFGDIIIVTYDNTGTLIDKIIDSSFVTFPNSVANVTFDEFQQLKPNMPLKDIQTLFKSNGLLTESTYKDVEGYFFAGDSYTWPTGNNPSANNYVICDFDNNSNLIRAVNYDKKLTQNTTSNEDLTKDGVNKFDAVNMGMPFDDVKSSFGPDILMKSIGLPSNYMSIYYYSYNNATITFVFDKSNKVIEKLISSTDYNFYDVNANNSENVNNIKKNMTYNDVKNIIGSDGYLCSEDCFNSDNYTVSENYTVMSKSYIWIFDDNSGIQIDFDFSIPDGSATQLQSL
ncbi:MAG: hypothetical protein FWC47_13915 [Oscillospiraceae bacterium]|nr:hypothetical protein [Oscillospiraceae bacterium]